MRASNVEFDGPQHGQWPQSERDTKKDQLSSRFGLPLLRIRAEDLFRTDWQLDRLTELIEQWFKDRPQLAVPGSDKQPYPRCPICGAEMARKRGKYGPFLSCVRYPTCKGSCDLPERSKRLSTAGWRKVLVTCLICSALVVAVAAALFFRFQSGAPQHGGPKFPGVGGTRSSMTLQEKQAYVSALKPWDYPACPRCGRRMVPRYNAQTGEPFFGSSDYPRCRDTREIQYPK
jgi:ssDNA-binding Zn-finger/Zn-ribbon topoisomerase 1